MILPSTYNTSISLPITERWKRNISVVCAWKYNTEILELQRDAWKRNRSVVCAWRYHTEILELPYITSISLPSLCNSNISV
jgi:hypothetical protein